MQSAKEFKYDWKYDKFKLNKQKNNFYWKTFQQNLKENCSNSNKYFTWGLFFIYTFRVLFLFIYNRLSGRIWTWSQIVFFMLIAWFHPFVI